MNKETSVWVLQLVKYFMFSHDYLQVGIFNDATMLISKNQYWLANKNNTLYPIIHISDNTDEQRSMNQPIVLETVRQIKELIHVEDCHTLDISLNLKASNYSFESIDYIALHPDCNINEKIESAFPQLNKVIYNVDNPDEELKKLDKELSQLFFKKEKKIRKKIFKENIKDNMCVSFIIPAVICIILFAVVNISAYFFETDSINTAIVFGAYYKAFITIFHQYFRLFTGGFIHLGLLHLICNMFALFSLAREVEKNYSSNKSLIILCLSIIIGNIFVYIGDKNIVAVGISGGIYGLFGALIVSYYLNGYFKVASFRDRFVKNLYVNLIINFLPNVSYLAHLGGLVCGLVLGILFSKGTKKSLKINIAICSFILCAFLGYMMVQYSSFIDYYYGTDTAVCDIYARMGNERTAKKMLEQALQYYTNGG